MTEKFYDLQVEGNIINEIVSNQVDATDPKRPILPEFQLPDGSNSAGGSWWIDQILSDRLPNYKQVLTVLNNNTIEYGNPELQQHRFIVEDKDGIKIVTGGNTGIIWNSLNLTNVSQLNNDAGYLQSNDLDGFVYNVTYTSNNHVLTFFRQNQPNIVIDLPIEQLITGVQLVGNDLVFTFEDGSTVTVPMNTLLVGVVKSVNGLTPNSQGEVILQITDIPGLQSALNGKVNLSGNNATGDLLEAIDWRHEHANKSVLDNLTQSVINNSHTHTNKALLDTYNQTNANITDAVNKRHDAVTLGTNTNGLSLAGQVLSLALATSLSAGAMSPAQFSKLDGIAPNANNYVLPTMSATVLGGAKVGSGLSIDSNGVLSNVAQNVTQVLGGSGNTVSLSGGGGSYTVPYTDWANIPNKPSTFTPSPHNHPSSQINVLTGYTIGTNTALSATDSLNVALGKIQAQINAKTSNVGTVTNIQTGTGLTGGPITNAGTIALSAATIASLAKADTALQSETDPTVPAWVKSITTGDITNWNAKQNALTDGLHTTLNGNKVDVVLETSSPLSDKAGFDRISVGGASTNDDFIFYSRFPNTTGFSWRDASGNTHMELQAGGILRIAENAGTGNRLAFFDSTGSLFDSSINPNNIALQTGSYPQMSVGSANVLTTARTINGTLFNGSANIVTDSWGNTRNITIGNTTKSVNGSANVSWSLAEIGIPTSSDFITTNTNQLTLTGNKLSTAWWQFAFRGNSWYKDEQGADRLYFGTGTNTNGIIFRLSDDTQQFQFRNTANTVVGFVSSVGHYRGSAFSIYGGTSSQFLKADGSVDTNTYALSSSIITPNNGLLTISTSSDLTGGGTFSADQATASNVAIGLSAGTLASLSLANTAVQPSALSNYYQSGDVNIPALGGDYVVFPRTGSSDLLNFDFNTITAHGFYNKLFNAGAASTYNAPKSGFYGWVEAYYHAGNLTQYAHPYRVTDGKWMRSKFGSTWTSWVEFIHSGNLATYANTLLTGFVPTSRTLTINGTTFDLSQNRSWNIPVPTNNNQLTNGANYTTLASVQTWVGTQNFSTQTLVSSASNLIVSNTVERAALTGDVTAGQNSNATTIANNVVSNSKLTIMAANTFKGRLSTAGEPQDLTVAQMQAVLNIQAPIVPNNGTFTVQGTGALIGSGSTSANASANTSANLDLNVATKNQINQGVSAYSRLTTMFGGTEYFRYWGMPSGGSVNAIEAFFNLVNPESNSVTIDIEDHEVHGARLVLKGLISSGMVTYNLNAINDDLANINTITLENGSIELTWDVDIAKWRITGI